MIKVIVHVNKIVRCRTTLYCASAGLLTVSLSQTRRMMPVLCWDRNGVQPPHGAVFVCIREMAPGSTKKEHTGGGRNERQDVLENRGRKHRDA